MNGRLHHYTADTSDRTRIHIVLFIVSVAAAWALGALFKHFKIEPYWWLDTPSVFGFYGIFFFLFNNYLWRISFFRKILFIETPNLNGIFEGQISSSYDNFQTHKNVEYEIHQKWNKILIFSETETSSSKSLTAAFSLLEVNRRSLVFNYSNTPKVNAVQTMNAHCGFADFYFENTNAIVGEFFNGRGRNTYGKIILRRKS